MTILQYITPSRMGGAEHFFLLLIAHLERCGHRVIVLTKRDAILRQEVEKLMCPGIEVHGWHTHGKFDPPTLTRLCNLIRREKVDVINTHLTTASWQGSLAGKITGVPVSAFIHATDRKTWFQHADHLIAVSGGVRQSLLEQNVPDSKIDVLYYGIDLRRYSDPLDCAAAKLRLGLSPHDRTVGVAASLIPRKGHRFLLEALKRLEPTTGPLHAIFAGEGPLETTLKAQAAALGLQDRVHFLGFRKDIREVLCAMDAFVLPSFKEGLSIAVMEAMALQKPVVVSDIAGMPEVVHNRETGLLVQPGSVDALANALQTLFQDPEMGHCLGRRGRQYLEQHFDQRLCLDAMECYFRRIAAKQPAPAQFAGVAAAPALDLPVPSVPSVIVPVEPATAPEPGQPLRVVQIIAPSKIAGAERSTVSLCRGLTSRGHRVWLLVKHGHKLVDTAVQDGVDAAGLKFGGKLNLFAMKRLAAWIRGRKVDIVATQLSTASLWGTLAARTLGIPSVATVRALNSKTCYVFADLIIVVSEAVKQHLVDQGIKPEKIRVVYNGIDLERFKPAADVDGAKAALGLEPSHTVIGVVAHLSKKKGHAWFLEAIAPVFKELPDTRLLLLGDGPERVALERQAQQLGIFSQTIFAGFHQDVVPFMAAMDFLVLPTIAKEGFGRVLVEAGAMAKPVIGTDIGGIGEVIAPGETGFVVGVSAVNEMREAVRSLCVDLDLRARLGAGGLERALSRFNADRMVAETERVYYEAAALKATALAKETG